MVRRSAGLLRSAKENDHGAIKEHMNVVGADGVHPGTVDHLDGERIKLIRADSPQTEDGRGGKHHYIPAGLVASVDGDMVRPSATAASAAELFEEAE